ncbi:cytochrome P450 4C1-like isoform X1 [Leptidea sinapis]|uniref:cytochrome P450 4C1-like isoform X1 n=2 Tax=Leptidea sinapis TaxID=189913 RepID=UPI0021C46941|nr:cytochrome P450 4C1-like isoform X1 [Leptidea sinapis]XP_050665020.1 cytochrome P450 4C1-like isoform X1 [Leptidea sinapis]
MLWQIGVVVLIILLIKYLLRHEHSSLTKLPGPPRLPIFGNTLSIAWLTQEQMFERMVELQYLYGHRVVVKVFNKYVLHLFNPRDIEVVLTHTKNITKNKPYEFMKPWLGTGLLISSGSKWHKRRKILTPAFHFDVLKSFARVFVESSRLMVNELIQQLQNEKDVLNVLPFISDFTLSTICETAMGTNLNSVEIDETKLEYKQSILDIGTLIMMRLTRFWLHPDIIFNNLPIGKRFKKCLEDNNSFTDRVIEERRKKRRDTEVEVNGGRRRMMLLDLLLDAESKGEIDLSGIKEEVNTFMFEGHDTTAMALTFGLMLLADHEEVQDRIHEECKSIFGDSMRTANLSDLAEMKYLEATIKEILRLYPSVPIIGRMIEEDFMLDDIQVTKGNEVVLHIYDLHRREDLFPEPEQFRPERFLSGEKMNFTYVPFSAGPRNCIGQRFAMQEMKYMLSEMIRHFKLFPTVKNFKPTMKADLVLRTDDPVRIKFALR